MTQVFVYEWCCGTPARGDTPRAASLCSEGWAMLDAAVTDFTRIAGMTVRTLLDAALRSDPTIATAMDRWHNATVTWVTDDAEAAFQLAASDAEFTLLIAPEFEGILETLCHWADAAGTTRLGPSPEAVVLTADKLTLAEHLESHSVPTPATTSANDWPPAWPPPWVTKPRFGAGSQNTLFITDAKTQPPRIDHMIVQSFVSGRPASVAFLIGPRQTITLAPTWQDLSGDGHFHYWGGSAPLPTALAERAERIARRAVASVPGLAGYVGVDVVLSETVDMVIEINPRLTTSYVGLRALSENNLMETLLRVIRGDSVAVPHWRRGGIHWTAAGQVELVSKLTNE